MAMSTTARFRAGSAPGRPRQTGQTCVLGGAPKTVGQPQKIFERVRSCAWTSSPMTGSNSATGHQRRQLVHEARARFDRMGEAEERLLVERLADELQADRQSAVIESAGHGETRKAGEVHRHRVDVVQV